MEKRFHVLLMFSISLIVASSQLFAGELVIKGSTTVLPIAQKAAEAYMAEHTDVKISLSGGGSGNGIKAIIDGTADIGNASRFIKQKEVTLAGTRGVYPVPFRVALDAIVPVVNAENSVKNLTMAQLKDIYLGNIKDWKEVGGTPGTIVVISRDSSSGTFGVWKDLVMKKKRVIPNALTVPSNGGVVQAVANTPGAIGYIGLGYITKKIKAVDVDGVVGSEENTLNGSFPISRGLFMFTKGWPKGETMGFISFILSRKGQKLVKEAGSIPLF
ncbi:phosphate ABC transporter substrate-binding protein, PhoT family [Desulfocicer vacuolatum DSM 3385]|uniref:Phosphate-binding protein n=1 Tax=Desulfocicer vacuolatum DSM 3385 TaxID=1121400 RepID=A0A1W2DJV1_9BACT|nr:phosphate ABC transporter substrate-binding protein [Desulfocicer vacuolatum]SMC97725.1 phosphate ABC transporter substrate-binding protein, PhoT family [Desulfocicer vacuolatum DSM 3385]